MPILPDRRLPAAARYLLRARGHTMNRLFAGGELIACVDCRAAGFDPRHGDVVLLERRPGGDGPAEITAKRLWRRAGKLVLAAESHEEGFCDFVIDPAKEGRGGKSLAIRAIVLRAVGELWRAPANWSGG